MTIAELLANLRSALDEPLPSTWKDPDLIQWLNDGIQDISEALRSVREDWMLARMKSTDSSLTIGGATFSPTSLTLQSGVDTYTLPADCLEIKSLEPLTQADKDAGIRFLPRDMTNLQMSEVYRLAPTDIKSYFYDIYGLTTLRVVPTPQATVSVEIFYHRAPYPYALNDTVSLVPFWCNNAVVQYAVWRAHDAINHQDTLVKKASYDDAYKGVQSMAAPRNSQDPKVVEGIFDEEDYMYDYIIR